MILSNILLFIFLILYALNLKDNLKKIHISYSIIILLGFFLFILSFLFFRSKYIYLFLSPLILLVNNRAHLLYKYINVLLWINAVIIILEGIIFYLFGKLVLEFIYNSNLIFRINNAGAVVRDMDGFLILRPRGLTGDLHVSSFLVFILLVCNDNKYLKYLLIFLLLLTNSVQTIFTFFVWVLKQSKYFLNILFVALGGIIIYYFYSSDGASESTISGILSGYKELSRLNSSQFLFGIIDSNQLVSFEIDSGENIESGFVKLIILYGVIILIFLISVILIEAKRFSKNFTELALNSLIVYFCFAHSSVGSSIWVFPLLHIIFQRKFLSYGSAKSL